MKTLLPLLALLAGCGGCVSVPSFSDLQATTLRLFADNAKESSICSGTATGPAELTTAKHCVDGYQLQAINGQPAHVASIRYVGDDEAIITLTAPMFRHWARRGPAPKQGERIRYWGNPLGIANVYREGVVVAVTDKVIAVSVMVCHGDSGAGMFDDKGDMVGVIVEQLPEQNKCAFAVGQR